MLAGRGGRDVVAPGLEAEAQRAIQRRVVVDDQDFRHGGYRSVTCLVGQREREDESCSVIRSVLVPDLFAVGLDERLGDGETETGPAALVELGEALEDGLSILRRDARSLVGHRDHDLIRRPARLDGDDAVGRRVSGGVVEQVDQDLPDQERVDVHRR